MKKIIALIIVLAVIASIIFVLMNNKKNTELKAKSSEIQIDVPVTILNVLKEKAHKELSIIGMTAPSAEVNIIAEVTGKVIEIKPQIGDMVQKGATIAKIDDELKIAALKTATANFEKAKKDFDRYDQLLKEKSINEVQFEQVKLNYELSESQLIIAKKQLRDCNITAPFTGMITARPAEIGSVLTQQSANIVSMIDVNSMKVKLNVPEKDVFLMKIGDEVDVTTDVNDFKYKGKIRAIVAKGDEAHTYPVELVIPNNSSYPLKAGMFVKASFSKITKNETLLIPRASLVGSIKDAKVYVVDGEIARLKSIVVGGEFGTNLEIVSGLNENDKIVVNGQLNLVDGAKIRINK
jgi:RND family efflux transporter MFP subunit